MTLRLQVRDPPPFLSLGDLRLLCSSVDDYKEGETDDPQETNGDTLGTSPTFVPRLAAAAAAGPQHGLS